MKQIRVVLKVIILRGDGRMLALKRPEKPEHSDSGLWDLPGGKIEYGEQIVDGLRREVREETGLNIYIHPAPLSVWSEVSPHRNTHYVGITMMGDYMGGDVRLSPEHERHQWMTPGTFVKQKTFNALREEVWKYIKSQSRTR